MGRFAKAGRRGRDSGSDRPIENMEPHDRSIGINIAPPPRTTDGTNLHQLRATHLNANHRASASKRQ
jgi:hypothetical protein